MIQTLVIASIFLASIIGTMILLVALVCWLEVTFLDDKEIPPNKLTELLEASYRPEKESYDKNR